MSTLSSSASSSSLSSTYSIREKQIGKWSFFFSYYSTVLSIKYKFITRIKKRFSNACLISINHSQLMSNWTSLRGKCSFTTNTVKTSFRLCSLSKSLGIWESQLICIHSSHLFYFGYLAYPFIILKIVESRARSHSGRSCYLFRLSITGKRSQIV
jgi:hypothetical protein